MSVRSTHRLIHVLFSQQMFSSFIGCSSDCIHLFLNITVPTEWKFREFRRSRKVGNFVACQENEMYGPGCAAVGVMLYQRREKDKKKIGMCLRIQYMYKST